MQQAPTTVPRDDRRRKLVGELASDDVPVNESFPTDRGPLPMIELAVSTRTLVTVSLQFVNAIDFVNIVIRWKAAQHPRLPFPETRAAFRGTSRTADPIKSNYRADYRATTYPKPATRSLVA
jgi:hypothetical protein